MLKIFSHLNRDSTERAMEAENPLITHKGVIFTTKVLQWPQFMNYFLLLAIN